MPLLDLKTDLKSLKYGNDQPGGGSSGQPYITTDINTIDTGFNRFRLTKFDDGLIRGGFIGATAASAVDTIRIGKFLTDFPKGPLFITKQVGLQLSNPKLETKAGVTGFFQSQPTRIYNLGINTLAQVPVNAFGGHFNRHGLLPVQDDQTKYFSVVLNNNDKDNNRLVKLKDKLIGTEDNIIDNYTSGPSSVYGIGRTLIRRRGDFIVVNQDITENEWAVKGAKEAGINYRLIGHKGGTQDGYIDASRRITNFTGVSDKTGSLFAPSPIFYKDKRSIQSVFGGRRDNTPLGLNDKTISTYQRTLTNASLTSDNITSSLGSGSNAISNHPLVTTNFSEILKGTNQTSVNYNTNNNSIKTYAKLKAQIDKTSNIVASIPTLTGSKFTTVNVTINRGEASGPKFAYLSGSLNNVFNRPNDTKIEDDKLALKFIPLNPFLPGSNLNNLRFLGYLTDYTENYDSSWNDVKYIGRAEKFYIFNEFKRTLNVGFQVPCFNREELISKHNNLSELASVLAGKYENSLLGGIITKLTIGNYINNQPGIITNLNFSPIQDSSWDLDFKLAYYLKISFGFTLIHDYLPQYNKNGFLNHINPQTTSPTRKPRVIVPPPEKLSESQYNRLLSSSN